MNPEILRFPDREAFRSWLCLHCRDGKGIEIEFDRREGLQKADALDEALCFGWIDGVLHKIDANRYRLYYTERRGRSIWSSPNKANVLRLEAEGRMTDFGREKVEEAKKNGEWDHARTMPAADPAQIALLLEVIGDHEPARTNFLRMSPSVQWTYTRFFLDAKGEETKKTRIARILSRLDQNLKPM